jgi:uncharacterized protein (DUF1800 family)
MRTHRSAASGEPHLGSRRFLIGSFAVFSAFCLFSSNTAVAATSGTTKATAIAAGRIADQSTFGPTPALIQHIQQIGLPAYVTEQLGEPAFVVPAAPSTVPSYCQTQYQCTVLPWYKDVLLGNDQLRQRVALALSEIFTVSFDDISPVGLPTYQNLLAADAFGNYKTLMKDVTLNPAMGEFLNMAWNFKPAAGAIADENYAREVMQLMSLGTCRLNIEGICQTYGGAPIQVYTQDQVQALARALTGWQPVSGRGSQANFVSPMVAIESEHDTGSKSLIDGVTLPAGQTAEEDMDGAISTIFADNNLPPFVSKLLIQHLVSSNPSAEYVARVATVFENDGKGVRGNMAAVVTAILLDPEARAGDTVPQTASGHLREPILWLTGVLRGLNGVPVSSDMAEYNIIAGPLANLGENPFRPDTVFSFYSPSYVVPDSSVLGPEFQLETSSHVVSALTLSNSIVYNQFSPYVTVNLTATGPFGAAAASGPGPLLDQLGSVFLHSQMPPQMRAAIVSFITPMKANDQIANAAYLIITSPQYKIVN